MPDVPEIPAAGETPSQVVERLSLAKARAVRAMRPGVPVLAADTVVAIGGRVLGKPRDREDAIGMLRSLSGAVHEVWTGVSLLAAEEATFSVRTLVTFRAVTDAEIERYVDGGEPMDKAGAYAIQGGAAGFVSSIDGSWTNVVGLPVDETLAALRRVGVLYVL